jgi:MFS family permease
MMWTGMVLVVASSLGAAFSTTVSTTLMSQTKWLGLQFTKALQVIMTQGLMYGFSSGLLFAPCISFVDEWFLQRRGLANGIL